MTVKRNYNITTCVHVGTFFISKMLHCTISYRKMQDIFLSLGEMLKLSDDHLNKDRLTNGFHCI